MRTIWNAKARSKRGILGCMMLLSLVLISFLIVSLGIDYSRLVAVRAQLRNAADAAAIGGAYQLLTNPSSCEQYALAIAKDNIADGLSVQDSNDVDVQATTYTPPNPNEVGTVSVDVTMHRHDIVSPLFGHTSDYVHVHAKAGGAGSVIQTFENGVFPLAVSLDYVPTPNNKNQTGDVSLLQAIQNGTKAMTLYINAQNYKNAAWTPLTDAGSVSGAGKNLGANSINNLIDQALGITPKQTTTIPSVYVGEYIYTDNGVVQQKNNLQAGTAQYSALMGRTIILPVISGPPPYNQSSKVLGFVAVKVMRIDTTSNNGDVQDLYVNICNVGIPGVSGSLPLTNNPQWDDVISQINPTTIKLLE